MIDSISQYLVVKCLTHETQNLTLRAWLFAFSSEHKQFEFVVLFVEFVEVLIF